MLIFPVTFCFMNIRFLSIYLKPYGCPTIANFYESIYRCPVRKLMFRVKVTVKVRVRGWVMVRVWVRVRDGIRVRSIDALQKGRMFRVHNLARIIFKIILCSK